MHINNLVKNKNTHTCILCFNRISRKSLKRNKFQAITKRKKKKKTLNTETQQRQKVYNHELENKRKQARAHLIAIKKCKYNWDSPNSFNGRPGV